MSDIGFRTVEYIDAESVKRCDPTSPMHILAPYVSFIFSYAIQYLKSSILWMDLFQWIVLAFISIVLLMYPSRQLDKKA